MEFIQIDSGRARKYITKYCLSCGKEIIIRKDSRAIRCKPCAISISHLGEKHRKWNGGKYISPRGYVMIYIHPNDPYASMANQAEHYVSEHRLVMAHHFGRPLRDDEIVHHINGNKEDNRLENLKIYKNHSSHAKWHWKNTRRQAYGN